MSVQDIILKSIVNLQADDGDLRGVLNHMINTKNGSWLPLIDIINNPNDLVVYVELPGIHNNIKVDFSGNKLTISGKKQKTCFFGVDSMENIVKNELGYGKYSRSVILPIRIINKKNVSTVYENGILCIKIDKNTEENSQFSIDIENSVENEK